MSTVMEIIGDIPNATKLFSKQLGKTDRNHQLIVPTKVLKHLPIEEGYYEWDFTAFDGNGDQWNFVIAIRQTGDYQKPFLRPPMWRKFVVAHGLSGNDHGGDHGVVFYIKNDEPDRTQVRALRRNHSLILGGQPVWEQV